MICCYIFYLLHIQCYNSLLYFYIIIFIILDYSKERRIGIIYLNIILLLWFMIKFAQWVAQTPDSKN